MEEKSFKREDYIYVRFLEDILDKYGDIEYQKGDIYRYKKEWLIEQIAGRQFNNVFDYDNKLHYEKNDDCDENDILYHKIYKSIIVSKNRRCNLYIWPDDYFYLNDWLLEHLDENGIDAITSAEKKVISDNTNDNKLIQLAEGYPNKEINANIYFKEGEVLDFSNPAVFTLFYDMKWIKLLAKTEVISGKEKEELFKEDFSNAIYAQDYSTSSIYKDDPTHNLQEYHYFKIKDGIKVRNVKELSNIIKCDFLYSFDIIHDENGYFEYVYTETSDVSTSSRNEEQDILKFADRVSVEEARKIHKKFIQDCIKQEEIRRNEWKRKIEEEKIQLQNLYESKKNDPSYFPGANGYFVHNSKTDNEMKKEKYTLIQIKEFYQQLKTLDPSIVREMCFYGGTVPYILNHASESREFGDIDIFVPVSKMEQLRKELVKQKSFKMICDSKPYAESCMLTTRIPKETTELVVKEQTDSLENVAQFFYDGFMNLMTPRDKRNYIDNDDIVHNILHEYKEDQLPYYRKIQDFGLKAKLFGIHISIFPIYQYENNIMAKSFNINEENQFLLGVKVLNNTNIDDFVKNVEIYDSVFKILPLEYTLVSKKSAVDENYSYRLEKDKEDVEYILSHKEELGIDDTKLQEILDKYPDYSISIAYKVTGDVVETMDGETYKEFVLTRRSVS